jgi:regulator of protease activity HflC (stomatin/prohibitin superfamily)
MLWSKKKNGSGTISDNPYVKNMERKRHPCRSGLGWSLLCLAVIMGAFWVYVTGTLPSTRAIAIAIVMVFAVFSVRNLIEWERAVVLRFGRFHKVRGPGVFAILPVIDQIADKIDIRIRVTDFSAQETLTLDSVTVTVDALCFWLVWDPEKALLEVRDYEEAVILSAKTALRAAISSHDLSTFLEHGEVIAKQVQEEVDKKTTEWGITIQYIEITDIQIPVPLQDALSRLAQAEREKKARILLAEAEIEIAKKLEEAVKVYSGNEAAMKLKILSILNEGLKAGNSMMLVPNSITEKLQSDDVFGLQALAKVREQQKAASHDAASHDAYTNNFHEGEKE